LRAHTLIKLKLGTRKGLIKVHLRTNFGRSRFTELRSIFRVNKVEGLSCQGKPLEGIWQLGGVTIVGVPFYGLKGIRKKPRRYDTKPNWCENYAIEFVNKNSTQLLLLLLSFTVSSTEGLTATSAAYHNRSE